MERRILTYGGYFERFMDKLSEKEREKVKWNIFRVFFIFDNGNIVVLFNGFQKKTRKTPGNEIERAIKIKKEYYADK